MIFNNSIYEPIEVFVLDAIKAYIAYTWYSIKVFTHFKVHLFNPNIQCTYAYRYRQIKFDFKMLPKVKKPRKNLGMRETSNTNKQVLRAS